MHRVSIRWTNTSESQLAMLPERAQAGLFNVIDDLQLGNNPADNFKPLLGPLSGRYRACFSRHRAVYSVDSETLPNGDVLHHVTVLFIVTGRRTESGKQEIRQLAQRLIDISLKSAPNNPQVPARKQSQH